MPFLIPAVVALSSDVLILWLSRLAPKGGASREFENEADHFVYHVKYLTPLAILRILLLAVPLLFHSYRGTALQCPAFYQILYWGTLVVVLFQMLTLSLINPASIEAIFPLDAASQVLRVPGHEAVRHLLEHMHELRRIWWVLTFSLISDMCHLIMFWHVRSTAPLTYSHFWLSSSYPSSSSKRPTVYYALRRTSASRPQVDGFPHDSHINGNGGHYAACTSPYHSGSDEHGEPALMHAMNDFMTELNTRLVRAKAEWTARLEDFTTRLSAHQEQRNVHHPASSRSHPAFFHLSPFRVLLQLFAYEDVLDNGKLDAVFDQDDGAALTFFVPQLLSFLLHGALHCSPQLEEWILDKCRRNVYFAHRCYWFLRAWCLEVPTLTPGNGSETPIAALSRPNSEGKLSGLTPFLDEPTSPQPVVECRPRRSSHHSPLENDSRRLFPEERQMIERLLLRVKECGEEAARVLAFDSGKSMPTSNTTAMTSSSRSLASQEPELTRSDSLMSSSEHEDATTRWSASPSSLADAVERGLVPLRPHDGSPSLQHFAVLSAQRRYGFCPLESGSERDPGGQFDKTPQFLDALLYLADSLFLVPREQRKEELRRQLRALECELLPSNSVYLPVGKVHHRVWRVVADESIAISTKERVPCIICLEVVDVTPRRRKPQGWGFLDRLPRRSTDSVNTAIPSVESADSADVQRSGAETAVDNALFAEADLVDRWRNAPRNPRRRTSLFDKVSTTVQNNVNVVKSQVQDHLVSHYRDRSVSEELQSLTVAAMDLESGEETLEASGLQDTMAHGISRASSGASLVSMGQWSSPIEIKRLPDDEKKKRNLTGIRQRVDGQSDEALNGSGSLRYGSDQEEEVTAPSTAQRSTDPLSKSSRTPPVVFREDWNTKQKRLRSKSAFGSHPGWRLLPILIKANDDLRQEQLASQLIYKMASILAREKVPVWLCSYEIIALTETGGIIEAIPDTISLGSLKKNDPNFTTLKNFFHSHFTDSEELADAKANFVESLAAYSMVCFLLQIKDRHNGNILLDNRGHLIHIDFGFFFLSSPGKNAGFESAPFKLTRDFVELLDGPNSHLFRTFRDLCVKTFIALRRHCMELILLVEMLKTGNEELKCFRGRPDDAIQQLRERFRLDLNDRACREYVNSLVDVSIENWRTDWYDRYQRYFVGVM